MKEKVYVVYTMGSYYDGDFPSFVGVYIEEPELSNGEYCEEIVLEEKKQN